MQKAQATEENYKYIFKQIIDECSKLKTLVVDNEKKVNEKIEEENLMIQVSLSFSAIIKRLRQIYNLNILSVQKN